MHEKIIHEQVKKKREWKNLTGGSWAEIERGFLGHVKLLACPKIGKKAAGILCICSLSSPGWAPHFHFRTPGAEFSRTPLLKVGPLTSNTPSLELVRNVRTSGPNPGPLIQHLHFSKMGAGRDFECLWKIEQCCFARNVTFLPLSFSLWSILNLQRSIKIMQQALKNIQLRYNKC